MALIIFLIWFVWERLAERVIAEPQLKLILIASDIVALVLIIVFGLGLGPIRFAAA